MEIYRYKFSPVYLTKVQEFINVHRFDEPNVFKAAWGKWVMRNNEMVQRETRRLTTLGYEGDISDKMYKSVRYYFKNKSTIKAKPKTRREYIRLNKSTLDVMDNYISEEVYAKPSESFQAFLEAHPKLICNIKTSFLDKGVKEDYIDLKIKKTYKNRCFKHFKNM
jgi:hypothetical protein